MSLLLVGTFLLPTLVCEVRSSNMGMAEDTTPNGSYQRDGGQIMRLSILCFSRVCLIGEMVKCLHFFWYDSNIFCNGTCPPW